MDDSETQIESLATDNKVNKRRSLIFQRQSIVRNEGDLENTNNTQEISQESKKIKLHTESNSFDIKKYILSLKEEDKKWREVYAKRKSQVQELMKLKKEEQYLDISCLSDSERAFLKARPDYEEFNENVFRLHALATKVSFLNLCAEKFREKAAEKIQNENDHIMHRIIKLSETE